MDRKLKPCPFCGGESRLQVEISQDRKWFTIIAKCYCCDSEGQGFDSRPINYLDDQEQIDTMKDGATWRWNRRA